MEELARGVGDVLDVEEVAGVVVGDGGVQGNGGGEEVDGGEEFGDVADLLRHGESAGAERGGGRDG